MKLAIFDVDGTLVDSRAAIHEIMAEAMQTRGLPAPSYDAVRRLVGLGLWEVIATLQPDEPGEVIDELMEAYKAASRRRSSRPGYKTPLYDGAADILARLKTDGWRLAIATGKNRAGVESVMRMHGWDPVFDSTHCDDDGPGKPHPAMLLAAMQAMAATPADSIMIGDTAIDMCMAKAAGIYAQGVSWGFHTPEEVAEHADHVAHDFAELDRQLARFAL